MDTLNPIKRENNMTTQVRKDRLQSVLDSTERIFSDHTFGNPRSRKIILGDMPDQESYDLQKKNLHAHAAKSNVSVEMLPCWREPLLSKEQEIHLFRKFNFLKSLARNNALKGQITKAEQFMRQAHEVREHLALSNMRLSIGILRRTYSQHKEDLLSEAYMAVYKSTEYFDWRIGHKFSTYGSWVIRKHLWKVNANIQRHDVQLHSDFELTAGRDSGFLEDINHASNVSFVKELLCYLTEERERQIIRMRFGIDCEPMTLQEIGNFFGFTKERSRQLQDRAIKRLRDISVQKMLVYEEVA